MLALKTGWYSTRPSRHWAGDAPAPPCRDKGTVSSVRALPQRKKQASSVHKVAMTLLGTSSSLSDPGAGGVHEKMLTCASCRPSMRLTAECRGTPHTLTYARDHLHCRSRAAGHLALHDRGGRPFDGFCIRAPQGADWTITPDLRRANARMDAVWLDVPERSHAREPPTENRRYTYDVA